jgi:hypothetical protein
LEKQLAIEPSHTKLNLSKSICSTFRDTLFVDPGKTANIWASGNLTERALMLHTITSSLKSIQDQPAAFIHQSLSVFFREGQKALSRKNNNCFSVSEDTLSTPMFRNSAYKGSRHLNDAFFVKNLPQHLSSLNELSYATEYLNAVTVPAGHSLNVFSVKESGTRSDFYVGFFPKIPLTKTIIPQNAVVSIDEIKTCATHIKELDVSAHHQLSSSRSSMDLSYLKPKLMSEKVEKLLTLHTNSEIEHNTFVIVHIFKKDVSPSTFFELSQIQTQLNQELAQNEHKKCSLTMLLDIIDHYSYI